MKYKVWMIVFQAINWGTSFLQKAQHDLMQALSGAEMTKETLSILRLVNMDICSVYFIISWTDWKLISF